MGGEQVPDEAVREWVDEIAARDYGGNRGAAIVGILTGAYARERRPDDPWAELNARVHHRATWRS